VGTGSREETASNNSLGSGDLGQDKTAAIEDRRRSWFNWSCSVT
jgi:hypothetical protein